MSRASAAAPSALLRAFSSLGPARGPSAASPRPCRRPVRTPESSRASRGLCLPLRPSPQAVPHDLGFCRLLTPLSLCSADPTSQKEVSRLSPESSPSTQGPAARGVLQSHLVGHCPLLGGPGRASKDTSTAQPGASWGLLVTGQANAGLGCPQRAERDQEEDPWAESQRQIRPRRRRGVKNAGLGGAVAPAAGAAGCDEAPKGDEAGPGHPGPRRPGQAVSRRVLQGLAAGRVCSCLALPLEAILS